MTGVQTCALPISTIFTQIDIANPPANTISSATSTTAAYIDSSYNLYGVGSSVAFGPGYGPWFPTYQTTWTSVGNTAVDIQIVGLSSIRKNNSNELYAAGYPRADMGIGISGSSTPLASLTKIGTTQTWQQYSYGWYISST